MIGAVQAGMMAAANTADPAFTMVFRTTGSDETVTIPCQNAGTFNANIDWGDGSANSTITAYNDADLAHVYATAGDYTVRITGSFPNIYFDDAGDKLKLIEIKNWGTVGFTTLANAFYGCANMTCSATDGGGNTMASVTSLAGTFYNCTKFNGAIGNWNVSNVVTMASTFRLASAFKQNIRSWNVGNVTNMSRMFRSAVFNQNIGSWNVGNVKNMDEMFFLTPAFNQDLSGWCVGNIPSEPINFGNAGTDPVWGTCPNYTAGAITYVGAATGTTTATLPTHQTGDLLIGFAFNDGSTTNPSVPSGWTNLSNTIDGTSCAATVAYKYATSASETSGTWTNATSLIILVYRNVATSDPLNLARTTGTGSTVTYPALATWTSPSHAWTIGLAAHSETDTSIETAPTGLTNRASKEDANCGIAAHDSNGLVGAWSATDVEVGGTSGNWIAVTLRLKAVLTRS